MTIRIEKLTESNFADYEKLTSCESGGGCYCAFWHQKWNSMEAWDQRKKEKPELNRQTILEKVKSHFHVGALAYSGDDLLAWISVSPLIDTYWFWKRSIHVGESAKTTAGITCFTVAPKYRGKGLQSQILVELLKYGKAQGWTSIEAYPFEKSALEKHGQSVLWPGLSKSYEEAGFKKIGPHWLNHPDWERALYKFDI
jgi:GNAT superfamily N-acetyltransferase